MGGERLSGDQGADRGHRISYCVFAGRFFARHAPWFIVFLALILRLSATKGDLPYLYNPGESIIVRQALAYGAGTLRPYTYIYPPLYSYILFALYGAYYLAGRLLGIFPNVAEFAISYFLDPTPFYWSGRIVTALLGAATVGLTYRLSARAYGRVAGLLAALFLALSHLHVTHSHYVLTDVPVTFMALVAVCLAFRATERGERASWWLAGLSVGLAAGMKYPAALTGITVVVGCLLWARRAGFPLREALLRLAESALCALLGFLLTCPYALVDWRLLWADLIGAQMGLNLSTAKPFAETMLFYLQTLFKTGLHPPLAVWSLAGAAWLIVGSVLRRRRYWQDLFLFSFPLLYLFFLGVQGRYQPNWLLPALPFFCIWAGELLVSVARALSRRFQGLFSLLVALLLVAQPAWYTYFHLKSVRQKDTRTVAKEWIEANIPAGTKILLDSSSTGPPLVANEASLERYFAQAEVDKAIQERPQVAQAAFSNYRRYQLEAARRRARQSVSYDLDYMQLAWWRPEEEGPDMDEFPVFGAYRERIYTLDQLRAAGFRYVVVSSFKYRNYITEEGRARWPTYYAFYRSLDEEATLVRVFYADPIHQPGPDIKIYDLGAKS